MTGRSSAGLSGGRSASASPSRVRTNAEGVVLSVPETLYGPWQYADRADQFAYDDTVTYQIAGEFLSGLDLVEDWGCGTAWAERYIDSPYRGIDGAWSKWAQEVVDLRTYRSQTEGALMRHVLEHNDEWRVILGNFMASWTEKAALVLFIPPGPQDEYLSDETWPVPDISLSGPDLMEMLCQPGVSIEHRHVETVSQYDGEDVFLLHR